MAHQSGIKTKTDKNYKIFLLNFYGNDYIGPIRKEYVQNVLGGLRRKLFLIDLTEPLHQYRQNSMSSPANRPIDNNHEDSNCEHATDNLSRSDADALSSALTAIHRCWQQYIHIGDKLTKELAFDTLNYWAAKAINRASESSAMTRSKRKSRLSLLSREGSIKGKARKSKTDGNDLPINCFGLRPQPHNNIGLNKMTLSKRRYIEDSPQDDLLYIIVLGEFDYKFAENLIRHGEPVQGIIQFVPGSSAYEQMIPNRKKDKAVASILEAIQTDMYYFRQHPTTKPVGVFQHKLPIISMCNAEMRSQEIYDQLTWFLYDIHSLYSDYEKFYLEPFRLTDVSLKWYKQLENIPYVTETLQVGGHYLREPLPAATADLTSICLYLDMLLNTVGKPKHVLNEMEVLLISISAPPKVLAFYGPNILLLTKQYAAGFESITKLGKSEQLCIDENNRIFCEMVRNVNIKNYRNIHACCLDYKLIRKYFMQRPYRTDSKCQPFEDHEEKEHICLLPYAKFYSTDDSVVQRLNELFDHYVDYEITEIHPQYYYYQFKRRYNEIIQESELMVLPTRLCFRDFSIFQMQEFLEDLTKSRKLVDDKREQSQSEYVFKEGRFVIGDELSIFLRFLSLRLRKIKQIQKSEATTRKSTVSLTDALKKSRDIRRSKLSAINVLSESQSRYSSADYAGLPADHRMLQGYNMEDIRQEVWLKTSKYYFEEGHLYLYEQRHSFKDTNEFLVFKLCDNILKMDSQAITESICVPQILRLTTRKQIDINLNPAVDAINKIIINYPNGLTVKHFSTYAEQSWLTESTFNDEKKRIFTPFGAVIVLFQSADVHTILRYNGEVYHLYQHEPCGKNLDEATEEDLSFSNKAMDAEEYEEEDDMKTMLPTLPKDSSSSHKGYIRPLPICRTPRPTRRATSTKLSDGSLASRVANYGLGNTNLNNKALENTLNVNECRSPLDGTTQSERSSQRTGRLSAHVINDQAQFLNKICKAYKMTYIHVTLTTSTGRVFNLTKKSAIYEDKPYDLYEWHDYFLNESYALRGDNVKMIWTSNSLKCFHADGSVFVTRTNEIYQELKDLSADFNIADIGELFEGSLEESQDTGQYHRQTSPVLINIFDDANLSTKVVDVQHITPSLSYQSLSEKYVEYAEAEHERQDQIGYTCVSCDDLNIEHRNYAGIRVYQTRTNLENTSINVEITALDNVLLQVIKEPVIDLKVWHDLSVETMESKKKVTVAKKTVCLKKLRNSFIGRSTQAHTEKTRTVPDIDQFTSSSELSAGPEESISTEGAPRISMQAESMPEFHLKTNIYVKTNDNYQLSVDDEKCSIETPLERQDLDKGKFKREFLHFEFQRTESLLGAFKKFIEIITAFKKYRFPKQEEVCFLECASRDCQSRGLEFVNTIPGNSKCFSNTVVNLNKFKNINKQYENQFPLYDAELKKFPRFQYKQNVETEVSSNKSPMVFSISFYLKIPKQLRCTNQIYKFMEPLDVVNFKATRKYIKSAMNEFDQNDLNLKVSQLANKISWQAKHARHQQLLTLEKQRKGLYHAILRHKTYPKYHKWIDDYSGKAACIDLFDFVRQQCVATKKETQAPQTNGKNIRNQEQGVINKDDKLSDKEPNSRKNSQS